MHNEFLRIEYGMERLLWQGPDQNQLDVWKLSLQRGDLGDLDDLDEDAGVPWQQIAQAVFYGIDVDRCTLLGERPFEVAEAHSAEATYYYEQVLEVSGACRDDFEAELTWRPSRVLFLHDVHVDPDRRRRGYASLLVADAILTLAVLGTAVLAHPGPTDLDPADDELSRLRSETANTRFLASLGFRPFRDRMWLIDVATQDAAETLAFIRRGERFT